jgi:hypothetical protein
MMSAVLNLAVRDSLQACRRGERARVNCEEGYREEA